MKEIERQRSAQRAICELLQRHPGLTINELAAARDADISSTRRRLDSLMQQGYVICEGNPRQWKRTARPLPAIVVPTMKSQLIAERRRRETEYFARPFAMPVPGDLERVFLGWRGVTC